MIFIKIFNMKEKDMSGIFKDFKYEDFNELSDEEIRKRVQSAFDKQKQDNQQKQINQLKKQVQDLQQKVSKDKPKKKIFTKKEKKPEIPPPKEAKKPINTERIIMLSIIVFLCLFIIIDFSFFHDWGSSSTDEPLLTQQETHQTNETATPQENQTDTQEEVIEEQVEEKQPQETVKEETQYSGEIDITIDKVYDEVNPDNDDMGYINKVVFTINNDKDEILKPYVKIYIYDEDTKDPWEERNRGEYTFLAGISPGKDHTATIDVSPKTFRNLDLKKQIRLTLNTSTEFLAADTKDVTIS